MTDKRREKLKAKVEDLVKISTIPAVMQRIMGVVEDDDATREDLERAVEHDQAIATRVVEMSNAAYYGFSRKIRSLNEAIGILGFDTIKGLALSSAVFADITRGSNSQVTAYWGHSFSVGIAAGIIARKTGLSGKDSPFLAGLIHDIGRPILFQIYGDKYLDLTKAGRKNVLALEKKYIGATHAEVGAWFADKCKFPEDMVKAVRYHHTPEAFLTDKTGKLLSIMVPMVYLADLVASGNAENFEEDSVESPAHAKILDLLELSENAVGEIAEELVEMNGEIGEYYA